MEKALHMVKSNCLFRDVENVTPVPKLTCFQEKKEGEISMGLSSFVEEGSQNRLYLH